MNRSLLIFVIIILTCASSALAQAWRPRRKDFGAERPPPPSVNAQPAPDPDRQPEEDCGCEIKAMPDVLAVVNGVRITNKEIDKLIKESVDSLQNKAD